MKFLHKPDRYDVIEAGTAFLVLAALAVGSLIGSMAFGAVGFPLALVYISIWQTLSGLTLCPPPAAYCANFFGVAIGVGLTYGFAVSALLAALALLFTNFCRRTIALIVCIILIVSSVVGFTVGMGIPADVREQKQNESSL